MTNEFEILSRFLERFGDEVAGRQSPTLPPVVNEHLRRFARGQLAAADQADLIRQLSDRPEWVAALAAEVKALRASSEKKP